MEPSLYRTFQPKYAHYSNDGRGRDNYISFNNGGLAGYRLESNLRGFGQSSHKRFHSPAPRISSPGIKYYSDGSGRDNYISCNSSFDSSLNSENFKNTLRTHQKLHSLHSDKFMQVANNYPMPSFRKLIKAKQKTVRNVIKRLFSPTKHERDNLSTETIKRHERPQSLNTRSVRQLI